MPGKTMALDDIKDVEVDVEVTDSNECSECGGKIIRTQGCKQCSVCGTRFC